jgi:hypothetical protein
MRSPAGMVLTKQRELTPRPVFMMMSGAERLSRGVVYQDSNHRTAQAC